MKPSVFFLIFLISSCFFWQARAQAPKRFSYQAVIRDAENKLVVNQTITVRISILQGSSTGQPVFIENHNPTTNSNGLITIQIGGGSNISGRMEEIEWASGPFFIYSETDPEGGSNFSISGSSELLSVPYAQYANEGGSPGNGIANVTDNGDGTITFTFDDQTTFTTQNLTGPEGPVGDSGNGITEVSDNGDGTITFTFDDETTFTTADLTGPTGSVENEADPIFSASPAVDITTDQITEWNESYNWGDHSVANYLLSETQGIANVLGQNSDAGGESMGNLSNLTIGGNATESSAIVEVSSTTKGLLPPRMTESERDAISTPAEGLMIYNLTKKKLQYFDGSAWKNIDGSSSLLPEDSYFVSPDGTDSPGSGDQLSPFRTISYALSQATGNGITNLVIANGLYEETITLISGINLIGGYDPNLWFRVEGSSMTVIRGTGSIATHAVTIIADNITSPTSVSGLVIYGSKPATNGRNSYGIYISNCNENLSITFNVIYAGDASKGDNGGDGADGISGNDGSPGADAFTATGTGYCNSSNNRSGGSGGSRTVGSTNISGGAGGGNQCSPIYDTMTSGLSGTNGQNSGGLGGGAGHDMSFVTGTCTLPGASINGSDGEPGQSGTDGSSGAGASGSGSITSNHWVADAGGNGSNGEHGSGGGGGGAGGGGYCSDGTCSKDVLGASGGGGGSGAGGGTQGTGGSGGGGSFCIFIINGSSPAISNNMFFLGYGGDGGAGGFGGAGGLGGQGAPGGENLIFCTGESGQGGNGGNGGHGGGGGGGAGGNAVGIFTSNVSGAPDYSTGFENIFEGGQGGKGGSGGKTLGNSGTNGSDGMVLLVQNT